MRIKGEVEPVGSNCSKVGQRAEAITGFHCDSHMRVSVPSIPKAILNATPAKAVRDLNEATQRLSAFLSNGNVTILTGAGVSVDSGIRAYRGDDGRYMNPNYKCVGVYHVNKKSPLTFVLLW